ncbi:hypothetical protein METH109765_09265 [Mesobacillus thioparans]
MEELKLDDFLKEVAKEKISSEQLELASAAVKW